MFAALFSVLTLESVNLFKIATALELKCPSMRIDSGCANLRAFGGGRHSGLFHGSVRTMVLIGVHGSTSAVLCSHALCPRGLPPRIKKASFLLF